jgi:hypothetical protein
MPATPPKLRARLVRAGKNGGWVAGGLSWGKLESLRYYGDHPEPQVRLLRELYALYRSAADSSGYYGYGYSDMQSRLCPTSVAALLYSAAWSG